MMILHRCMHPWVIRIIITINVVVLLYLGCWMTIRNGKLEIAKKLRMTGRYLSSPNEKKTKALHHHQEASNNSELDLLGNLQSTSGKHKKKYGKPVRGDTFRELLGCQDKSYQRQIAQRGNYWVLYNYVPASRWFRCDESITYTTHGEFTFLDNLEPLLYRWRGPISVALYTPGNDFAPALASIRYLRKCRSPLIAKYVTFHLYFETGHVPKMMPHANEVPNAAVCNCSAPPPWTVKKNDTYRSKKRLLYPINVGRNVARQSATTHYVLPSDIELYPSPGVIDGFMDLVRRQDSPLRHPKPMVFPLPIFELSSNMKFPANKNELVSMLKNGSAITFHKNVCPDCHKVPKFKEWASAKPKPGIRVFHTSKRTGKYKIWEPIFIGTQNDPLYDERLSWEGKMDKMTQGYTLCVLDYEFHILDNAFLTHKPGIKTLKEEDPARRVLEFETFNLTKKVILPELKALYGVKKGCVM